MPGATAKRQCPPSDLVKSESSIEQIDQIEDIAAGKIRGKEIFGQNVFTNGLPRWFVSGFLAPLSKNGRAA